MNEINHHYEVYSLCSCHLTCRNIRLCEKGIHYILFFESVNVLGLLVVMALQYVKEVCISKFAHSNDVAFS